MSVQRRVSRLALVLLVGLVLVAALSGVLAFNVTVSQTARSSPSTTTTVQGKEFTIKVADKQVPWGFTLDSQGNPTLRVKQGDSVKIVFMNNGNAPHDFEIADYGIQSKILDAGGSQTLEFKAEKTGNFSYFCSVPGHRELGMEGQFIVE